MIHPEKVSKHITNWLKDYAESIQIKGFVVGVSGGIDSAVTSSLCAATGLETLCVEMPIHQDASQVSRAQEHIMQLEMRYANVRSVRVDLSQTFETFKQEVPKEMESEALLLTLANTRARLRMSMLYYFAGLHGYLVAGTGNKIEDFGIGFYTKYGDGGVDLSPIADLMKSEVFALGAFLLIPESILTAAPTDGLFSDSPSDEEQIGASYDELEWAMNQEKSGKNALDFEGREQEVFTIYQQRNKANKHKMEPIPVCLIPNEMKD